MLKLKMQGSKLIIFSREPNCIFKSYLKVLCMEPSTSLGSLQQFEGGAGEFKGALGFQHRLISSPEMYLLSLNTTGNLQGSPVSSLGLGIQFTGFTCSD